MWQAPISTTQPIKDQPIAPPPGMSGPAPTAPQRRVFNPGGRQMPVQAKAKGLTSWLGAGNNPSISKPNPMRGGRPAQQNPYLKLAGANANRSRLGRGFQTPNRGFQRGLGQAYQNFLGGQATPYGPAMQKPRGKAFRGDIGRSRAMRMRMRNLQRKQPPMTPQPVPMPAPRPEYATPTISNPPVNAGGPMQMLQPTDYSMMTNKGTAVPSTGTQQWQTLT